MRFNEPITKKNKLFSNYVKKEIVPDIPVIEIPKNDWRNKYPEKDKTVVTKLENTPDDSILNRMVKIKNVENTDIIEVENGKIVYDKSDNKLKAVVNDAWVTISTTP